MEDNKTVVIILAKIGQLCKSVAYSARFGFEFQDTTASKIGCIQEMDGFPCIGFSRFFHQLLPRTTMCWIQPILLLAFS